MGFDSIIQGSCSAPDTGYEPGTSAPEVWCTIRKVRVGERKEMKEGDKDEKGRSWRGKQVLRKDLKWQCHEARKYLKEEGRDRRRLKTQKVRGPYM